MALDFPNSPTLNQVFAAGDGRSWKWNGATWDSVLTETPPANYAVSDTAPSNPQVGDGWFDSTVGKFFIYYDSFWVEFGTATGPAGADGADGADGGFSSTQTIQEGTTRALTSADAGKLITNAGAITITVEGLSVGQQVDFVQTNAAQITFTPGTGVTLNSKSGNRKTAAQFSPASIKCVASNSYVLVGDLAA